MKKFTLDKKSKITAIAISAMLGAAGLVLAATSVNLGTADDFAVLAGAGITNTGATTVTGDIGTHPTLTQSGFGSITLNGTNHVGNATTQGAKTALVTAYGNASQVTTGLISADLGGQTLTPGVYQDNGAPASLGITGTLTLNGQGDANAVFIFKSASTLTTAASSQVTLINGAQACNVFWQVGSSATLGTSSNFKGNILAMDAITDNGGSTIEGRLLARNAAVTLNNTTVTKATCVVPPPAPVSNSSASSFAPLPLINITKIPSPAALPGGSGVVNYTYTVSNVGKVAMIGVWVTDNKCSTVKFLSGDTNKDSKLDINETWFYSCSKTVSQTETNTAIAHGQANGWDGYDTANATVVVGTALPAPLIHLVKKPNVFVLPAGGGAVTYDYTVTNPGTVPLHDVSVIDDKCTGLPGRVLGHPGDLNKNNLLESNESWSFTCQTNITQTTTNIGTAEGHANGLTAIDFSPATVVVAAPGLPSTGVDPSKSYWGIAILLGALVVLLTTFFIARRNKVA